MGPFASFHIPGQPQRPTSGSAAISSMAAPLPPAAQDFATKLGTGLASQMHGVGQAAQRLIPSSLGGTGDNYISPDDQRAADFISSYKPPPKPIGDGKSVFSGLNDYAGVFDYMGGVPQHQNVSTVGMSRGRTPVQGG